MSAPPPPLPPSRDRPTSNAATFTALMLLLAFAGALFFLVLMINPFALGILAIVFLFVPMTVMHYLVWGRWLQQMHRDEDEEDRKDQKG